MSPSEYLESLLDYVQAQGWTTSVTEIREGTYIIAGSREKDADSERMLLMAVYDPEDKVTTNHLEYLLKTGQKKNVDSVMLTYTTRITEEAQKICEEYDVSIIDSEKVQSNTEPNGFEVDSDDISIPEVQSEQENKFNKGGDKHKKEEKSEKERIFEIKANYTQSDGRSVGGKLLLHESSFEFKPHSIAKLRLAEDVKKSYDEIQDIDKEEKLNRGLKDAIIGGGLRDRLKIKTEDNEELLFVVSDISKTINNINQLKQSEHIGDQLANEPNSKQDKQSAEPNTLTLGRSISWIVGIITLYVGLELFVNQGRLSGFLYLTAGGIVMPYTRKYVESGVGMKFGRWFLVATWIVICFAAAIMFAATPT